MEDEREALLLCRVRAEHLREEERAEVGDRCAHWNARADAAEREVLDREARGREVEPELARALLGRAVHRAGHRHAGDVALDVSGVDRDARGGELLGDHLERPRLPRPRRAGDQAVAVHRRERQADGGAGHGRAAEHGRPELDGAALRRVRLRDLRAEGRGVRGRLRHGARSYHCSNRIQYGRLSDPRTGKSRFDRLQDCILGSNRARTAHNSNEGGWDGRCRRRRSLGRSRTALFA